MATSARVRRRAGRMNERVARSKVAGSHRFTREICTMEAEPSVSCSPADKSTWTESLKQVGVYFEGVVDDADTLVLKHTNVTVTTYGTRTSRKTPVYYAR